MIPCSRWPLNPMCVCVRVLARQVQSYDQLSQLVHAWVCAQGLVSTIVLYLLSVACFAVAFM